MTVSASMRVLLLPGWLNSDDAHWQSRWETLHGHERVEQDDWLWPRRGDWGSQAVALGACGHVNGESGLGDWPAGLALLRALPSRGS